MYDGMIRHGSSGSLYHSIMGVFRGRIYTLHHFYLHKHSHVLFHSIDLSCVEPHPPSFSKGTRCTVAKSPQQTPDDAVAPKTI